MYPRNNATPERIAVGQVVLIADGTVQTSAVVITVRGQGGAEATGGGTTAYGAEGTVYYTPTQAETNYTSFVVIASKASCFSASQTIITTASSTSGTVDVYSIGGTAQTANDNGADINALISDGYPARFTTIETLIGDIGSGSAGISVIAGSSVEAVAGTPTNTYAVTDQLDGIYHIVPDLTNNTDFYYEFDIGVNGVPIEVEWVGYAQANNATYNVYFYNWTTLAWNQVGFITGTTGATEQKHTYTATVDHVGTGGDDGTVRFRFLSTDGANLGTDFIVCDYAVVDSTSIAAILTDTGTTLPATLAAQDAIITEARLAELDAANLPADIDTLLARIIGTLATGTHNPATAAQIAVLSDWINGGRLDLLLDAIKVVTDAQTAISPAALIDLVWDEPYAAHLTAATMGLSEVLGSVALIDTTLTGTPTATTVQFTAGSTIDDFYNDQSIYVLSGTGAGQVRVILDYTGATRTATVDEAFVTTPAAADRVAVLVGHVHPITQIQSGLATEAKQDIIDANVDNLLLGIIFGAAATGTLSTTQATSDLTGYTADQLIGRTIIVTSGVADGEGSDITDYVEAAGLITFTAMTLAMGNGDTFKIV